MAAQETLPPFPLIFGHLPCLPVVRWKARHRPSSRKVNQSTTATSCVVDAVSPRRRLTDIMRRKGGRRCSPPSCAVVRRRQGWPRQIARFYRSGIDAPSRAWQIDSLSLARLAQR